MKKNEIVIAVCQSITDLGYGVLLVDDQRVFVKGLLPGEKAKVLIVKVLKHFAFGKLLELFSSHPNRIEPVCPVALSCGGCSLQHVTREKEMEWKKEWLEKTLRRRVDRVFFGESYQYRNKAIFPVDQGKLGFYRPHSHSVVHFDQCALLHPTLNQMKAELEKQTLLCEAVMMRVCPQTNESQVILVGGQKQAIDSFAENIVWCEKGQGNVILGDHYEILKGSDCLSQWVSGFQIRLHFKAFFQVNQEMMEVLYAQAIQMADLKKSDRVLELYAGTGTIGLLASRLAGQVDGVEIVPEAVENANENAKLNGVSHAHFWCMDASDYQQEVDVLFVDPPRKGLSAKAVETILGMAANRLVYVSCHPKTLARDLDLLEKDYVVKKIIGVDLFSRTPHLETVVLLLRK